MEKSSITQQDSYGESFEGGQMNLAERNNTFNQRRKEGIRQYRHAAREEPVYTHGVYIFHGGVGDCLYCFLAGMLLFFTS